MELLKFVGVNFGGLLKMYWGRNFVDSLIPTNGNCMTLKPLSINSWRIITRGWEILTNSTKTEPPPNLMIPQYMYQSIIIMRHWTKWPTFYHSTKLIQFYRTCNHHFFLRTLIHMYLPGFSMLGSKAHLHTLVTSSEGSFPSEWHLRKYTGS